MSINLGALDIGIATPGLPQAEAGLKRIDTLGERAAESAELLRFALGELGQVSGAIRDAAAAMTALATKTDKVGDNAPPATAKLRGLAAAVAAIGRPGNTAGLDAVARRVQLYSTGLQIASTRTESLAQLGRLEGILQRQLAAGNLRLQERIRIEEQLAAIATARAGTAGTAGAAAAGSGILGGLVAGVAGAVTLGAVAGGLRAVGEASDRAETAQRKLKATSALTGVALAQIASVAGDVGERLQLSEDVSADLAGMMTKLAARTGEAGQAGKALLAWMDLAAANGQTTAEALQALETTLMGQDEGLNRLGLQNPQQIYEKWAKAAGVSAAKMTDAQKAQAILNEVVAAGTKVQGEAQRALDTTAGKQQQLAKTAEETAKAYGRALDPLRRLLADAGTATLKLAGWTADLVTAFGTVATVGGAIWAVTEMTKAVKAMNAAMLVSGSSAATGMLGGLVKFGKWIASAEGVAVLGAMAMISTAVATVRMAFRKEQEAAERFAAEATAGVSDLSDDDLAREQRDLEANVQARLQVLKSLSDAKSRAAIKDREAYTESENFNTQQLEAERLRLAAVKAEAAERAKRGQGAGGSDDPKARAAAIKTEVDALAALRERRELTASEAARAATLEAQLTTERDRLAAATGRTADETARLVAVLEQLDTIQRARGIQVGTSLIGGSPGRPDTVRGSGLARPSTKLSQKVLGRATNAELQTLGATLKAQQEQMQAAAQDMGLAVGQTLAGAIGQGFASLVTDGLTDGMKAFGATLVSGLGAALQQFGTAALAASALMAKLKAAFASLNPFVAASAAVAMIALGGVLQGAASSAFGGGRAGSGGGASLPAWSDQSSRIGLGRGTAAPIAATLPTSAVRAGATAAPPAPVTVLLIGPDDPRAARQLQGMLDRHARRSA